MFDKLAKNCLRVILFSRVPSLHLAPNKNQTLANRQTCLYPLKDTENPANHWTHVSS